MLHLLLFYVPDIIEAFVMNLRATPKVKPASERDPFAKSPLSAESCTKSGEESKCAARNCFLLDSESCSTRSQSISVSLGVLRPPQPYLGALTLQITIDDRVI